MQGKVQGRVVNPDGESDEEFQRRLESEMHQQDFQDGSVAPDADAPTPVPRDLIQDIRSFKDRMRSDKPESPKPAPSSGDADPTKLRLSSAQQANLPTFLMTVHVYDADASRRFVLINGVKYREGEKTRVGLGVERILPDGAVLSFQGSPFFVHR